MKNTQATSKANTRDAQKSDSASENASQSDLYALIQSEAYFRAESRGFAPGAELQDWYEAEKEITRRLAS